MLVHDFHETELGKAIPYGVYDLTDNQGWVSVGIDHDTAEFAAAAIRRWWRKMGRRRYPKARGVADYGRWWRQQRQPLPAVEGGVARAWPIVLGIPFHVCHFPPGTSKWNKIEHRLFCHITQNWRGRPLVSHEIIIKLIGSTTTEAGLQVQAGLDRRRYLTRKKVSNEQLAQVRLTAASFHGEWNYTVAPD